jgi:hypothetical protein
LAAAMVLYQRTQRIEGFCHLSGQLAGRSVDG